MTISIFFHPTIEKRLTKLARRHHPGTITWWREQPYKDRKCLRCLVCGQVMDTWSASRPRPYGTIYSMDKHYEQHAMELLSR